ncbi:hypothetical protein [Paracoccus halophilus]|uniref:hypothetical protein n=1 Tax=Paracoccus halophilus TaxID=376733 RepID=UPI0011137A7B|nr:hypothetical protein [Paracoccus halophilus]
MRIYKTLRPASLDYLPWNKGLTAIMRVSRATALRNASIIMKPARQGSFIFELIVLMEANPATTAAAVALTAAPFYDFLKVAFKRATGFLDAEPETPHLRSLYERREPPPLQKTPVDLDDLAEKLEGSLQAAHRPIGPEGTINRLLKKAGLDAVLRT